MLLLAIFLLNKSVIMTTRGRDTKLRRKVLNWQGQKVLIVDDSQVVRATVRRVFSEAGFTVCGEVENGALALEFLAKNKVDVISLDVIMPEMNGIDCLRTIVQKEIDVKTIFLSYLFDDRQITERLSEEFPGVAFLCKPLTLESLHSALDYLSSQAIPYNEQLEGLQQIA